MTAHRSMSPVIKRIGDVRYHQSISIQEPLSFAYMFYKKYWSELQRKSELKDVRLHTL